MFTIDLHGKILEAIKRQDYQTALFCYEGIYFMLILTVKYG